MNSYDEWKLRYPPVWDKEDELPEKKQRSLPRQDNRFAQLAREFLQSQEKNDEHC